LQAQVDEKDKLIQEKKNELTQLKCDMTTNLKQEVEMSPN